MALTTNDLGFTCLVITADDVTIDLTGFVISANSRRGDAIVAREHVW